MYVKRSSCGVTTMKVALVLMLCVLWQQWSMLKNDWNFVHDFHSRKSQLEREQAADCGGSRALHIMFVFTNPAHYVRRRMLTTEALKRYAAVPCTRVYLVELAYGNASFEIAEEDNTRHLRLRTTGAPLWHKENLINIGVARLLPSDWDAFAWIDSDTTIIGKTWASSALEMLKTRYDVIQLYKEAIDEDMDRLHDTPQVDLSFGYQHAENFTYDRSTWHPGYAWAISRQAYEKVGGLYEYKIVGGGDQHMAMAVTGRMSTIIDKGTSKGFRKSILAYEARAAGLRLGYIAAVLVHHFHGSKERRRYTDRRHILIRHNYDPESHLTKDGSGVLVPSKECPQRLMIDIKSYIYQRNEDEGLQAQSAHRAESQEAMAHLFDNEATFQWPDSPPGPARPARYLVFIPLLGTKYGNQRDTVAAELVSLEAWREVAEAVSTKEQGILLVVGMVEDARHCYSRYAGSGYYCMTLPARCRHADHKILTLDCAFNLAMELGKPFPPTYPDPAVLIFSNGDLVYTPELIDAVIFTREVFGDRFVGVGRRMDLNMTELGDDFLTLKKIRGAQNHLIPHAGWGVDYFIFTEASFPGPLPPFLVGRWRWDNALLLSFFLNKVPSVDLSTVVQCTHLGFHASDATHHVATRGSYVNDQLAANWNHIGNTFALGSIDNTEYVLKPMAGASESVEVSAITLKLDIQEVALDVPVLQGIRLAIPWNRGSGRYLPVIVVPHDSVLDALNWVCLTKALGLPKQLYVTYSSEDSLRVRELGGNAVTLSIIGNPAYHLNLWREVDKLIASLLRHNVTVVAIGAKVLFTSRVEKLIAPRCHIMRAKGIGAFDGISPRVAFDGTFLAVSPVEDMTTVWGKMAQCDSVKTRPLTDKLDAFGSPIPMTMSNCVEVVINKVFSSRPSGTDCDVTTALMDMPQCFQSTLQDRESCREQLDLQYWVNERCRS